MTNDKNIAEQKKSKVSGGATQKNRHICARQETKIHNIHTSRLFTRFVFTYFLLWIFVNVKKAFIIISRAETC